MNDERKEPTEETSSEPKKKEIRKKIQWNRQYTTIAVYAFLVILAGILCVVFFQNYGNLSVYVEKIFSVLNPVFLGILFAYLLNPILRFFENHVFWRVGLKKGKNRLRRTLSVICTYLVLIAILVGFVMILVPQIVAGYKDLMGNMSNYIATIETWLNSIGQKVPALAKPISKITASFGNFLTDVSGIVEKIIPSITSAISGILTAVKNSLLGLVLSIYFLLAKEQLLAQTKKVLRTMLSPERYELLLADAKIVDENFGGFFFGKIFDSLIIGVLCFISMAIIGIPYYPLVSLIVGVTNIIPFFGPIIGAIPSAFIIFIASPIDAVWFIILILVIQQLDGNYIGPKILSSNTALEPVWIIIAITLMSGLFGFGGMLLGVPLFAVLYVFIKRKVEEKLERKNCPSDTEDYYDTELGLSLHKEREEVHSKRSSLLTVALMKKGWDKLKTKPFVQKALLKAEEKKREWSEKVNMKK